METLVETALSELQISVLFPDVIKHVKNESLYRHFRSQGKESRSNNYEQSEWTVLFSSDAAGCIISCFNGEPFQSGHGPVAFLSERRVTSATLFCVQSIPRDL